MKTPRLVIFDGNALIHRAFHALPPLTVRKTGETVGAVYGFAQILLKALGELQPTHYAIAFDKAAPTFRHVIYGEYKATRKETPSDLIPQFKRVHELVEAFKMPIYEVEGYEADDVLGTVARQASEQGIETVIVTGDADAMQLVTEKVKVFYPRARGSFSDADIFDEPAVEAKYSIKPRNIADYKALKGDPSDNIKGVPGIGDKTAVKLIQQFGGIDDIYRHINEVTPPKLQALLREREPEARQSKELATIVTNAPVNLDLDACRTTNFDRDTVVGLLRDLEFVSLITKLPEGTVTQPSAISPPGKAPPLRRDYHIVSTIEALDALVKRLEEAETISFDVETDSQNAMLAHVVGISLSPAPSEAHYIPIGHTGLSSIPQLPLPDVVSRLKPVLENNKPKTAHDGKFDMTALAETGIYTANLTFDTMIAGYLLSEQALNLNALAFKWLGAELTPISDLIGTGVKQIPMSRVEIEKTADFSCAHADMTRQLVSLLQEELKLNELWQLFDEIEMPLVPVLVHMERCGILLDTKLLKTMSEQMGEQLKMLEGEIYRCAKQAFNINSPKQLGEVLFDKMGLPAPKKKGGSYSTAADILEALSGADPIIGYILDYRGFAKLKSTYIDALPALINPKTSRVHTSFNQTRTTTGRLSSSDPNLQNIPIRGEQGRQIREAFIAPLDCVLLGADYSQIDLRSLAHLSQDENLLEAFRKDEDIHSATAAQLFGVTPLQVTADMRRLAKTVNFGVIYGMSEFGLEQATELSREQAGKFIHAYFEKYPGVRKYLEETKQHARSKGFVQTLLGRQRPIPEINSANRFLREAAERMAINMPVQGTSADIIKKAMVDIYRVMVDRKLKSKMLLQVHDELVFEVPEAELEEMRFLVPQLMANAITLAIPLKVDVKVGKNWGEMEK
jgi:DNA polymerase-1